MAPPLDRAAIVRLDRRHVWHPYTPMEAWENEDPIVVARAKGAWLEDVDGQRDWWVD